MLDTLGWHVSPHHPNTSHAMHAKARLKAGKNNHEVFWLVYDALLGMTDDELELATDKAHQSISATRRGLVKLGYLEASHLTRPTRYGNEAIVWVVTAYAQDLVDQGIETRTQP